MKSLGIAQSIVYEMLYEKVKLSLACLGTLGKLREQFIQWF